MNHSAGATPTSIDNRFYWKAALPFGSSNLGFVGQTQMAPADGFWRTLAVPNNGMQRLFKASTGSSSGGGSGGGTNTTGIGQIFPTGYYV